MEASEYVPRSEDAPSDNGSESGVSQSPWQAHAAAEFPGRPEIPVIAAFVGGFVFARILKALGGDQ
jgi:hypothetical protein